jgi:hypothetical protein
MGSTASGKESDNHPCFTESKASFQILAMQELYVAKAGLWMAGETSPFHLGRDQYITGAK